MARTAHEAINTPEGGIGGHQYPPQSAPIRAPHGLPNFVDGSGPIFSMYLEMAEEEDKKMAESWKADADGILIFTGLFSAAVASLISVSIQDIRPNPQDTSNFYLANIYQAIADPNRPNISLPSSPPTFSPPNYAVWVNALWFMSLVISLTCALLATLLQQWARRYLKVTQPHYSLHKRARIRAFFFEGVEKYLLPWVVDVLPTLLHVSLFLFFAGLVVFLRNIDLTIFKLVLSWVGVCTAVYGCITFVPIFCHDSPYHTPLTSLAWLIVIGISYASCWVLRRLTGFTYCGYETWTRFQSSQESYREMLMQNTQKAAEETALHSPSEIDARAFMWTFDCLDEDHELERFFSGLPGFRRSKVVNDPLPGLTEGQKQRLSTALTGLLDVTFSSNLLPETVKNRRAIICAKAFDPAHVPGAFDVLDRILSRYDYSGPMSTELVQIMGRWRNIRGNNTNLIAAACSTIARVQRRDDSWFSLASNTLDIPESFLRDYAALGNSLSLAILIHVTRQHFSYFRRESWPWFEFSGVLVTASEFNVQDTLPEMQHEFCALWNQVVLHVQNNHDREMAFDILGTIRKVYITLHKDTDSAPTRLSPFTGDLDDVLWDPSSYPVCNVAGHTHNDPGSITFASAVKAVLPPGPPASLDAPSSSVQAPLYAAESLKTVTPFDNDIYVLGSFRPAHQTAVENLRIPATSQDTGTAHMKQGGIETSVTTVPLSIPESSASTPPTSLASPSPPGAVQLFAGYRNSSDVPDFPTLVLDNKRPTGPQSYPTTRSEHVSSPQSHSILVTSASPSPTRSRLSPAPVLRAAAEGEDSAKAASHNEGDALDTPSAIRENIVAAPDLPLRPLSPSSVTDIAVAGHLWSSVGAELMGDHPPHPSYGRDDVV